MAVASSAAAAHEALVKNDAALAARFVPDNVRAVVRCHVHGVPPELRRAVAAAPRPDRRRLLLRPDPPRPGTPRRPARRAPQGGSGTPVNIREAVNGTVLNVVSNVLFSEDVVGLREQENQTFKRLVVPCAGGVVETQRLRSLPFLAPLEHLLGSRRRISTHLAKLFKSF